MKTSLYIEWAGDKVDSQQFSDTARQIWKDGGNKIKDLESMELFYKPDEKKCYYVFNGTNNGVFDV